jgi:hypothetical protein
LKLKELGGNIFGKECTCGGSLMSKNLIRIQPHYEAIQAEQFTLKQILQQNWCSFLDVYHLLVQWYAAYNIWKVINCREPDGFGYATFACPVPLSSRITGIMGARSSTL